MGFGIVNELQWLLPEVATLVDCPGSHVAGSNGSFHASSTYELEGGEAFSRCYANASITDVVMHLNDNHKWTREAIADWLDTLDVDLTFPTEPPPRPERPARLFSGDLLVDSFKYASMGATYEKWAWIDIDTTPVTTLTNSFHGMSASMDISASSMKLLNSMIYGYNLHVGDPIEDEIAEWEATDEDKALVASAKAHCGEVEKFILPDTIIDLKADVHDVLSTEGPKFDKIPLPSYVTSLNVTSTPKWQTPVTQQKRKR